MDTVILGRKTYEKTLSFGIPFPHADKTCYVLTGTPRETDGNLHFHGGDVSALIGRLKSAPGGDIFLDGGAEAVRAFRERDLIDTYVISILPVLLGRGIRLFAEIAPTEGRLELAGVNTYPSGLVQLRYDRIR